MKNKIYLLAILFFLSVIPLRLEIFIKFASTDKDYMNRIKGKWLFSGSRYLFEFTDIFSRRIDGMPYYLYKNSKYPNYTGFIYSVFRSKKTGISYFCRGNWSRKRGFQYTVSVIKFKGKNRFMVYSKNDPTKIYFTAKRFD